MGAAGLQFLLSLLAVAALVLFAHWLGFSRSGRIADEDEARDLFALAVGGFDACDVAIGAEGRGAIALDNAGRLAVLFPHGREFVARVLGPEARLSAEGGTLHVMQPDLPRGTLELALGEPAQVWAERRAPAN
ncbi:MAG: hypothetical protein WBA68_02740 [Alteraurantiacibacter sp.]